MFSDVCAADTAFPAQLPDCSREVQGRWLFSSKAAVFITPTLYTVCLLPHWQSYVNFRIHTFSLTHTHSVWNLLTHQPSSVVDENNPAHTCLFLGANVSEMLPLLSFVRWPWSTNLSRAAQNYSSTFPVTQAVQPHLVPWPLLSQEITICSQFCLSTISV